MCGVQPSSMENPPTNPDLLASVGAGKRTRPTPPPPSPHTHLSFSSDASCIVLAGASAAHWICCDTFQLRGLYQEKNLTRTIVHAAGDMLALKESTCAIVCYSTSTTGARFFARRWNPGFLNYHWRYAEKEMQTGGHVRAVRVHRDRTVVVFDTRLCVFGPEENGGPPRPGQEKNHGILRSVETVYNEFGLCAVTSSASAPTAEPDGSAPFAFACPGAEQGELRVERWVAGQFVPLVIRAHVSGIAALAMSPDGRLVATASVRGTIVRLFRAEDGELIGMLRRGTDRADIHCIAFSPDSKWLAVSSDKATVHVFRVADYDLPTWTPESELEQKQNAPEEGGQAALPGAAPPAASPPEPAKANKGSSLSFLKGYLPSYFSSEWSLAQFRLPEGVRYSVAFGRQHPNTVLIIGTDGSFYRCRFDPANAGDMKQLEHRKFMRMKP